MVNHASNHREIEPLPRRGQIRGDALAEGESLQSAVRRPGPLYAGDGGVDTQHRTSRRNAEFIRYRVAPLVDEIAADVGRMCL